MLSGFKKIISLGGLRDKHVNGQIATLLILVMAVVLVFVIATINIGELAIETTKISNVTDSAALLLGSRLSTKATVLYKAMGDKGKRCKLTGWGRLFLGSLLLELGSLIFGNYLIDSLLGSSLGNLLLKVMPIGAGAAGALSIKKIRNEINRVLQRVTYTDNSKDALKVALRATGDALVFKLEIIACFLLAIFAPEVGIPALVTILTLIAGAGGTAAIANMAYTNAKDFRVLGDSWKRSARRLNNLPEYDRYKETVFFEALSLIVDDPNRAYLPDDPFTVEDESEGDDVAAFIAWWERRVNALLGYTDETIADIIAERKRLIREFLENLRAYSAEARSWIEPDNPDSFLSRQEIEGGDGTLVALARTVYAADRDYRLFDKGWLQQLHFYRPGPEKEVWEAWHNCEDCEGEAPENYDRIDLAADELRAFVDYATDLLEQADKSEEEFNQLSVNWRNWVWNFYDPEAADPNSGVDSFYHTFGSRVIAVLSEFRAVIRQITIELWNGNRCVGSPARNAPCAIDRHPSGHIFSTADANLEDDEFALVSHYIDTLVGCPGGCGIPGNRPPPPRLEVIRGSFLTLYNQLVALEEQNRPALTQLIKEKYGGLNPVKYTWQDSLGEHSVEVEVSRFPVPYIKRDRSWYRVCHKLWLYADLSGDSTWVKVTRTDPANQPVGILGKWNPYDPDGDGKISVSRTSKVSWGLNQPVKVRKIR